jgi:hypothetical protein
MERVMGIEPTSSAWKAEVLPLNYTRLEMTPKYSILTTESAGLESGPLTVEGVGFEPTKA